MQTSLKNHRLKYTVLAQYAFHARFEVIVLSGSVAKC